MSESNSAEEGEAPTAAETNGWYLEKNSWGFHRSAFRLLGQALAYGEYGYLRRQISSGQAELLTFGGKEGVYSVQLRDGMALDVLARMGGKGKANGKVWYVLLRAMRPARKPRAAVTATPPQEERATALAAPPVAAPAPEPEPQRRASTLSLGASARTAAEVLAARLQPKAPPPRLESVPAQKAGQQPARPTNQKPAPLPSGKRPPPKQRAQARR